VKCIVAIAPNFSLMYPRECLNHESTLQAANIILGVPDVCLVVKKNVCNPRNKTSHDSPQIKPLQIF